MTDQNGKPLKDSVLDAIKCGDVQMRPRWHFIVRSALIASGIVAAALALIFVVSLMVYSLHVNGAWFAPSFGLRGLRTLLTALPWVLVLMVLLFTVLLEVMVQRFAFAYRNPLLYSALGVIGVAAVGGYVVSRTPLHDGMYRIVQGRGIPVAGIIYRQYGEPHLSDVHPGLVSVVTDDGFLLQGSQDDVLTVRVTPQTRFVPPGHSVAAGDFVVVFGDADDGEVEAIGVRRFDPSEGGMPGQRVFIRRTLPSVR